MRIITEEEKVRIRELTQQRVRQSHIAKILGVPPSTIHHWQVSLGLETRLPAMTESKVIALADKNWSVSRISRHFGRRPTMVTKLLRRARTRRAKIEQEKREVDFRAAVRQRAAS